MPLPSGTASGEGSASLVDSLQGHSVFLAFLHSAVLESAKTRRPHEALQSGLYRLAEDVGWPVGHLLVRDPHLPDTMISSGIFFLEDPERLESFRRASERTWFKKGAGLPGRVLESGKAVWQTDIGDAPDLLRGEEARVAGLRTAFAFPVRVDGEIAAILEFFTYDRKDPNLSPIEVVERIGVQLGQVVEQAWERERGVSLPSAGFYRAILDGFPLLVWRSGSDGVRSHFNIRWLETTGRTSAEEADSGWLESVHPKDRARVRRICAEALEREEPFTVEYRLRRHDGEVRWMTDVARPFRDSRGNFAGYIGSCYDVTRRYSAVRALARSRERLEHLSHRLLSIQEEERLRIARGLHDDIGQLLAGIKISLGILVGTRDEAERAAEIRESVGMLDRCIESVRALALDLRPPHLEELGLGSAIRWYLDRQMRPGGAQIMLELGELEEPLSREITTAAFRVVQEAVTNAQRHASADRIVASIRSLPAWLEVRVVDDGVGFDPDLAFLAGAGLPGMEERVALLGGELAISSTMNCGTEVLARFPFAREPVND